MEIIFEHIAGKQEKQDFHYMHVRGLLMGDEEYNPLDQGWLAADEPYRSREYWYQSRSTRAKLLRWPEGRELTPRYLDGKLLQMIEIRPTRTELTLSGLETVYHRYIKRKGYRNLYDPFRYIHPRDMFLVYYVDSLSDVVGFTKIKRYVWEDDGAPVQRGNIFPERIDYMARIDVESNLHCNTRDDVSMLTLEMELEWARKQDAEHLYMGPGYEKSSIYKSRVRGFEWWNGIKWSRDVGEYKRLCHRDTVLSRIDQLSR